MKEETPEYLLIEIDAILCEFEDWMHGRNSKLVESARLMVSKILADVRVNDWKDASKRLPSGNGEYIVCVKDKFVWTAYFGTDGMNDIFQFEGFSDWEHEDVTHWKYLPKPPIQTLQSAPKG